jgi:DNA-binding FadR family transcriptional regulator
MVMGFTWTEATMDDYHEVRSALEPLIVRHAARRRNAADIRALQTILANMESHLDKPLSYVRYNTAFHRRIAKLTGNAPLRSLYLTLLDFFENDLAQGLLPPAVDAANLDVHRQLLDAIAAGEGPAVDAAIARHDHLRTSLGMFRAGSDAEVPAISK